MFSNLQHISTLDQDLVAVQVQPCDVLALVRALVADLTTLEVPIQLDSEQSDVTLMTDAARLRQILENLLLYAIHHSPRQVPVQVSVACEQDETAAQEWAVVVIRDWGPHLPATLAAPAEEPASEASGITVLGIGVYLASRLVMALDGTLRFESRDGRGTLCTLRLPLTPASTPPGMGWGTPPLAMVARDSRSTDITDAQWDAVQRVLPPPKTRGRKPSDTRRVLNGIVYVLQVGCPWRKLPRRYGNYVTCWRHYIRWQGDGTWRRIQHALLASPAELPVYET